MIRAFLDANVLFSAAYSKDSRVREIWNQSDIKLVTSTYAIEEADRNLDCIERKRSLRLLTQPLEVVDFAATRATDRSSYDLPASDQPILWAAIDAQCSHLITGDLRHFGHLMGRTVEGVFVALPREFLSMLRKQPPK